MDKLASIKAPVADELAQFSALFSSTLVSDNPLLHEVLSHVAKRKGKMMRPILVMLIARLFGTINSKSLHAAVALELLHTASLVHDDVVDESSERRGLPSVNAIYNNKVSILSGDYLLATALLQATNTNNVAIINVISRLGKNLSEGELLQLSSIADSAISEKVYFSIIEKKTAALFAASAKVAALSVGASDEELQLATKYGEIVGTCFQIRDDIFDYYNKDQIGKPTGNDMQEGKLTLPAIYAVNNSKENIEILSLVEKVKQQKASNEEIQALIDFSIQAGGIDYAYRAIEKMRIEAIQLLTSFPNSEVKKALVAYVDFVAERTI